MSAPGRDGAALVIGEALVDVVINPGEEPREIPGGSPANVALGLARLGRDAHLTCWIAQDPHGQAIRDHLERSGVTLTPGSDGAARTSTAQATIGENRAATYLFDLDWNPPYPVVSDGGDGGASPVLVHTGSIAAILAPGSATVEQVLSDFRDTATVCYDPNARPQLMGEPDQARAVVERLIALADVVKCSDEDVSWLYGEDAVLDDVLRGWLQLGPAVVVATRGKDGALALSASGVRLEVPADPNVVVADTVGAGDSFMGGLEDALWSAGLVGADRREALRSIDATRLEEVVRHAAAVADITVSREGANPPTRAELG